jgi:hypothetical protein
LRVKRHTAGLVEKQQPRPALSPLVASEHLRHLSGHDRS